MSIIAFRRIRDCYDVEYEVVQMPGNGLCGYHSLAYTLTWNICKHDCSRLVSVQLQHQHNSRYVSAYVNLTFYVRPNEALNIR